MKYIARELERKFEQMNQFFKVVLVTGARQVGKTTMLKHLAEGTDRTYVSLDDLMIRDLAQSDPALFFQTYKPPILIDEVQHAPQLFEQIKLMCEKIEEPGQFWLTGSQQYHMMKHVWETLAGRIGILELYSLSQREKRGALSLPSLDFSLETLQNRQRMSYFFEGLGVIFLLPPYSNNELKRLVRTPKLYFCDTGLCAYLFMRLTRDTLMNGAASGHFFENYVVIELD